MTEEMVTSLSDFERADFSEREKLALRFAERMATDNQSLDGPFFAGLRQEFTDPEIYELGLITGQFIGYGRLIAALDLEDPAQPPD